MPEKPVAPNLFRTLGQLIECTQCQAKSRRTSLQCRAPAIRGKRVCRFHGGLSTGPKSTEGRKRCSEARLVHGKETIKAREARRKAISELNDIKSTCIQLGLFEKASRLIKIPTQHMVKTEPYIANPCLHGHKDKKL